MKRSPIATRSRKKARELQAYSAWRFGARWRRPNCEFPLGCDRGRLDWTVQHMWKRSQGAPQIPESEEAWMPLCLTHHMWVEDHPLDAEALGCRVRAGEGRDGLPAAASLRAVLR